LKRKIIAILLVLVSVLFVGCTKDFEYGSDKFSLECILEGGLNTTWYYFRKKIDTDMIMEPKSQDNAEGYELIGQPTVQGFWDVFISDKETEPYISAGFCGYYSMGDAKLNIYFNYTVASTGERKEEIWEVDFGQEPYEDKR